MICEPSGRITMVRVSPPTCRVWISRAPKRKRSIFVVTNERLAAGIANDDAAGFGEDGAAALLGFLALAAEILHVVAVPGAAAPGAIGVRAWAGARDGRQRRGDGRRRTAHHRRSSGCCRGTASARCCGGRGIGCSRARCALGRRGARRWRWWCGRLAGPCRRRHFFALQLPASFLLRRCGRRRRRRCGGRR